MSVNIHQFVFRSEPGDTYLAAVSKFILNAYEFGDATAPESSMPSPEEAAPFNGDDQTASHARERSHSIAGPHNLPYLSELGSLFFSTTSEPVPIRPRYIPDGRTRR